MEKYEVGEIWWTLFPFKECDKEKRRPAIVIDNNRIAILAMYVTSQNKDNPFSIEITNWKEAGLPRQSWARIDKIISIDEWRMDQKIGTLTDNDKLKILQLVAEIITETVHEFSLVAVKNKENKYLQKYDEIWKCWLFPYFRSTENNKANVDSQIKTQLQLEKESIYVAHANHCKYSVSDDVYKIYNHKLYKVNLDSIPDNMIEREFTIGDNKFCWMSIDEMENNKEIMEKNEDVVAFVKTKIGF